MAVITDEGCASIVAHMRALRDRVVELHTQIDALGDEAEAIYSTIAVMLARDGEVPWAELALTCRGSTVDLATAQ